MASFSDALQALAEGRLRDEVLLAHLENTLSHRPELLQAVLSELATAYASGLLEAQTSAKLKAHALRAAQSAPAATGVTAEATVAEEPTRSATAATTGTVTGIDTESATLRLNAGESNADIDEYDIDLTQALLGEDGKPHAVGSIVKERFVLDEIVGVGGMGTVYKGRDLRKVEARDKNPYVALKVLNEDFKKHPDAFIALQREASRQQKLAHPNIATVYDFDRSGNTVYLTMEYLEGQPLNTYIRKEVRPRGGIPFAEAFPIIRGLGQALGHAHERDVVHSDFKPANCFLTTSGTVKVLDFGIARLVKGQEDAEKTLFDPSSLGALTPAYASVEMLNGEAPDTRDDIYALACVAYELLAGRHPYDRKPATYAHERKMVPAPIRGLTRAQMRALMRALSLTRAERTPSVNEFIDELQSHRDHARMLWILGGVLATLLALALYWLSGQRADRPPQPDTEMSAPGSP